MILFTAEEIELLHMQIIDVSGGGQGVRDRGRIEAAVATQSQAVFGGQVYPSIFDKAAALARGIIGDHPFVDGNKRTGIMSVIVLLERNDVKTKIAGQELEDFAVKIAVENLSVEQISAWLKQHTS